MAEGAGAAGLAAMLARPDLFGAGGSAWCCAAATSMRGSSPPSWCANWSGRTASPRSASPRATGRGCSVRWRAGSAARGQYLEVSHGRLFLDVPAKGVTMDVTIETRDSAAHGRGPRGAGGDGLDPQRLGPRGLSENAYETMENNGS